MPDSEAPQTRSAPPFLKEEGILWITTYGQRHTHTYRGHTHTHGSTPQTHGSTPPKFGAPQFWGPALHAHVPGLQAKERQGRRIFFFFETCVASCIFFLVSIRCFPPSETEVRFESAELLSPARAAPRPSTPRAHTPCELKPSRPRGRPGEDAQNRMDYDMSLSICDFSDFRVLRPHRTRRWFPPKGKVVATPLGVV